MQEKSLLLVRAERGVGWFHTRVKSLAGKLIGAC